jgi:hypothetical protein
LSKSQAPRFLEELGFSGTEVKDVLLKLSSNTKLFEKNLKIAHDEYRRGTSIANEYAVASAGLEAQLTKSQSALTLMMVEVGKITKSPLIGFLEASTQLVGFLSKAFIGLSGAINTSATGYAELFIALDTGAAQLVQRFKYYKAALTFDDLGMDRASAEWVRLDEAGKTAIRSINAELIKDAGAFEAQVAAINKLMNATQDFKVSAAGGIPPVGGGDVVPPIGGVGAPIMPETVPDFSAHVTAHQEYIAQLEESYAGLRQSTFSEEALWAQFGGQQQVAEEAFQMGLISNIERKSIIEALEAQHIDKLNKLTEKGMTERQKFEAKNMKDRTKSVLGEMATMTAGVANSNKAMFEINKVAALANAGISMYEGISRTLSAYPYPINIGMAALHGVAALAQISSIQSQSFGGGAGATSTPTAGGGVATTEGIAPSNIPGPTTTEAAPTKEVTINLGDRAMISTEAVRELIEEIQNEAGDMGLKIMVAS